MSSTRTRAVKRGSISAATVAAALALSACGGSAGGSADLTEVVFAQPVPQSVIQWPSYVADELGYFAEEGIKLTLAPSGDISMAAFVTNGTALVSAAGATEVLFATREGADVQVVMDWWTRSAEGVVTMDESPLRSAEDLDGHKVGVASDEDRAFLAAALGAVGIDPANVETVITGGALSSVAAALRDGTIDAFAGATSDFAALRGAGINVRDITPEALAATPASSMVVTGKSLTENRELIVGFLRAYAKATHAGLANPEALRAMSIELVPDEWRDEESGDALTEVVLVNATPDDMSRIGDVRMSVWEDAQRELLNVGELTEAQDLTQILDDSLIADANDFDRAEVDAEMAKWLTENS